MSNGRRLRRSIRGVKGKHARHSPKRNRGFCGHRDDVAIAVCRGRCGRYTTVWLPAKFCERCLIEAAIARGMDFGLPTADEGEEGGT